MSEQSHVEKKGADVRKLVVMTENGWNWRTAAAFFGVACRGHNGLLLTLLPHLHNNFY
jgi:hypothetical protein